MGGGATLEITGLATYDPTANMKNLLHRRHVPASTRKYQ